MSLKRRRSFQLDQMATNGGHCRTPSAPPTPTGAQMGRFTGSSARKSAADALLLARMIELARALVADTVGGRWGADIPTDDLRSGAASGGQTAPPGAHPAPRIRFSTFPPAIFCIRRLAVTHGVPVVPWDAGYELLRAHKTARTRMCHILGLGSFYPILP